MTKHEKKAKVKSVSKLKAEAPDLDATRKAALDAQAALKKAGSEATALVDKAAHLVARASSAYREAVTAYREACRKAGVECECPVGSSEQEDSGLAFVVETTDGGARVIVKGKPGPKETAETEGCWRKAMSAVVFRYTRMALGQNTCLTTPPWDASLDSRVESMSISSERTSRRTNRQLVG